MNKTEQNFQQYQRSNTIIFAALLIGQVFFASFAVFINQMQGPLTGGDDVIRMVFMIMLPLFFLVTFSVGKILTKQRLKLAKEEKQIKAKLEAYRSVSIIKYALLEGTAFFAIITYLLTGEYLLLGFAVMMMFLFATYYPSKEKLVSELELNRAEQAILEDPTAVVAELVKR
jgi:MFS family permease